MKLLAIDPEGCGCTECLIGEYRPLNQATDEELGQLIRGELKDNTSEYVRVEYGEYGGVTVSIGYRTVHLPEDDIWSLPPSDLPFEAGAVSMSIRHLSQLV